MSVPYTTILGRALATPGTLQFTLDCAVILSYRISENTFTPATSYYFDNTAGDDDTGDGSIGAPYKTLAKATAIAAASGGNIGLYFKRGSVWAETPGLTINNKDIVLVADYGDAEAAAPIFRYPFTSYSAGWSDDGGGRYSRAEASTIAILRKATNSYDFYRKVADAATVSTTAKSWCWTSGTLYINPGADGDPNASGIVYESFASNNIIGIRVVTSDQVCLDLTDWTIEGYSANVNPSGAYAAVQCEPGATDSNLVRGVKAGWAGNHVITQLSSSGAGGFVTVLECETGPMCLASSGASAINFFNAGGGHEFIVKDNAVKYGTLPVGTTSLPIGIPVYSHTTSSTVALHLDINTTTDGGPYGCHNNGVANNAPVAATLADVRAIIVGGTFASNSCKGKLVFAPYHAYIGQTVTVKPWDSANLYMSVNEPMTGWAINCKVTIDLSTYTNSFSCVSKYNLVGAHSYKLWHSHWHVIGNNGTTYWAMDWYASLGTQTSNNAEIVNTIFTSADMGAKKVLIACNNLALQMRNNSYTGISDKASAVYGYSNTANLVEPEVAPTMGAIPGPTSPLYGTGEILAAVEHDFSDRPTGILFRDIGPLTHVLHTADLEAQIPNPQNTGNSYTIHTTNLEAHLPNPRVAVMGTGPTDEADLLSNHPEITSGLGFDLM